MTWRNGWGAANSQYTYNPAHVNNRMTVNPITGGGMQYDDAGNLTNDGSQSYSYDATGQQAYASGTNLRKNYDGDGMRAKKTENGDNIYYLRSSVLGGQVVAEIYGGGVSYAGSGWWLRGYVYLGGQMIATQAGGVNWVHQDPVTKSQRITDSAGNITYTIDLDPWGSETGRTSGNAAFQPHRFTSYERDANAGDDAMFRRYQSAWTRFSQPDPYEGSYDLTDPQSFNRYAYVQNDPVNYVDPTGLIAPLIWAHNVMRLNGGRNGGVTRQPHYVVEPHDVDPQKTVPDTAAGKANPNCLQNAVPGSPGLARRFGRGHDGPHARAPLGGGIAITLGPLAGTVINVTGGGDGTNIVDVRLANGDVAVYKDLGRVFVGRNESVGTGARIGTVSGGGFGGFDGLHLSLVRGYAYDHYRQLTRQAVGGTRSQQAHARSELSRLQPFMLNDPLGPESPVRCPGVPIIDVPVRGGVPTTYPPR
jgi:RHS repeat-associated protein